MDEPIHYVTAASLAELKKEYETVKNVTIPEIAKRIDEAKQQGDLSENAEYHQAREDMAWAQGRALELEKIIANASIIVKQQGTGAVAVGNTIVVAVGEKQKNYTIVGPQEINPVKGLISNESPLGEAFLGHKVGETVEVNTPAGKMKYKILEIK
ncbi:MAG: transcription elongation factor GreA [Candidatus Magasanikbacteria bacterium]|nr:transcription elongation factor GreA [Candidatus Magasanikbacteria bacterium]